MQENPITGSQLDQKMKSADVALIFESTKSAEVATR
jgi:hypothetical protein